ncbi:hypothetical protein CDD81_2032 [Ophiocordyceps australis]|uniref:Fe2OG dioxygenase domain-containing protein n=1 Tax=Ophiocordyceps australis TaxID=1399860 RepID=A0A2C5YA63_9HYPO|nr:hypothetical protein CDD81_2032 [Ophiocordyceps australis]
MSATASSAARAQQVRATEGYEAILEALREDGAVIIKNLITTDDIHSIDEELRPALEKHREGSELSDEWLKEFHGAYTKRLMNLITLSKTFRQTMLENGLMHKLCEEIFLEDSGTYWMNSAQVIDIGPGSRAQPLHRDQWQFPIFNLCGPDAPEASINFIFAMNKVTEENGATRVILGSHKWSDLNENGTPEDTIPLEMEPGDAAFFSSKVVHGGGANTTTDVRRKAISVVFQCSYLTPEEAFPFLVKKELAETLSPRVQRMIGFRSQFPNQSPGLWKCDYSDKGDIMHGSQSYV